MNGPFHPGELAAQARAGVAGAGAGIRSFMPDQHRTFFASLPYLLAATVEADGRPRAHVLTGAPGFIDSPDDTTLRIAAAASLVPGQAIGLLGLDFGTRRRNRANGVVRSAADGALVVDVRESFGNCPQFITLRDVRPAAPAPQPVRRFEGLDAAARALVARADTFFVATSGGVHGLDISHRGGPAGFIGIDGATLTIPDFKGNRYFNTLGNMLLDPRAALLFIDFETGSVLELEGSTEIVWEDEHGARRWRFTSARGAMHPAALPLRWSERRAEPPL